MAFDVSQLLGLGHEPKDLTLLQIALRALIVFIATLIIVRLADKRFMARINALDAILTFVLGSMLARAVNGSAAFFPTLAGGLMLVLFHRFIAFLTFRWEGFGNLVKGKEDVLMEGGQFRKKNLRKNHISEKDFLEELRLNGNLENIKRVKRAVIERSGEISVVKDEG